MNLLEVKNICKTYGSGETAVKALKVSPDRAHEQGLGKALPNKIYQRGKTADMRILAPW